jgi:cysteine desulfurase
MQDEARRLSALRDKLLGALRQELPGVHVNGPLGERRLPHNLHVSFEGVEGERLLMSLGDLAVSTGSACSAGSQKASHVLEAIGASQSAGPSIRFGLGRETSEQEIETAAARVVKVVRSLRDSAVTA